MEIKLKIQLTVKELYDFLIAHTYSSFSGWAGVFLSVCALVSFAFSVNVEEMNIAYKFVLLLTGLLFTVIQPVMLYQRARNQVKQSEAINKPLEYTISYEGITVACGEEFVKYDWNRIMKITSTKKNILVYTSSIRAFVLPKREISQYMDDFKKIVREKCTATSIRIR